MWARVASFEGGDLARLREETDRRMAEGSTPSAMKGALVLQGADANKRLFVGFYENRAAIEQTEAELDRMGDEIPEEIRGRRTAVDYYEVVYHQPPSE